jgi:uncharacterized protein YjbJ (UPF0337 family)
VDTRWADVRHSVPLIWRPQLYAAPSRSSLEAAASCGAPQRGNAMDKDRIAGAAKQAKGAIKDAAGKVTGDTKLQAEGKADKAEGKVQSTVGGANAAARAAMAK